MATDTSWMGPTIQTDYPGLKRMAKEFFELAPTATDAQLENGFKCFILACMGCTFPDDFIGATQKNAELPALRRIVEREFQNRRFGKLPEPTKAQP